MSGTITMPLSFCTSIIGFIYGIITFPVRAGKLNYCILENSHFGTHAENFFLSMQIKSS